MPKFRALSYAFPPISTTSFEWISFLDHHVTFLLRLDNIVVAHHFGISYNCLATGLSRILFCSNRIWLSSCNKARSTKTFRPLGLTSEDDVCTHCLGSQCLAPPLLRSKAQWPEVFEVWQRLKGMVWLWFGGIVDSASGRITCKSRRTRDGS